MTKKISLTIGTRTFSIDLEEDFGDYFQEDMKKYFSQDDNNVKTLLYAYIEKTHELYCVNNNLKRMVQRLNVL